MVLVPQGDTVVEWDRMGGHSTLQRDKPVDQSTHFGQPIRLGSLLNWVQNTYDATTTKA